MSYPSSGPWGRGTPHPSRPQGCSRGAPDLSGDGPGVGPYPTYPWHHRPVLNVVPPTTKDFCYEIDCPSVAIALNLAAIATVTPLTTTNIGTWPEAAHKCKLSCKTRCNQPHLLLGGDDLGWGAPGLGDDLAPVVPRSVRVGPHPWNCLRGT